MTKGNLAALAAEKIKAAAVAGCAITLTRVEAMALAELLPDTPAKGYVHLPKHTQEARDMLAVSRAYLLAHHIDPDDTEGGSND